ncbi:hypothetical protein MDUV_10480 [Mycolicibacterium duvalii]|uniref:Uncharacterized protein n=1 Tax=Mycolicibacterium duvalii TaxID=39688 RepID=A0A7I7JXY5_9MYCO|nr:hypothetical protein MDUV_10480 [Mycolicibacterium duvalii]
MSEQLGLLNLAWEAWRFRRGDGAAIACRQQKRLDELVLHARTASPYYRHLYRHVATGCRVWRSRVEPAAFSPSTDCPTW